MSFFSNFPTIEVDVLDDGTKTTFLEVTRKVRFKDLVKKYNVTFDYYDVQSGQTPEFLAKVFYNDEKLHWVLLLANDVMDYYHDWPLTNATFDRNLQELYDNPDAVHHYEVKQTSGDTTKVIEIPSDSANTIPEDAVIVTNYNYAERAEDNKRQIRVIKPEYIPQIKREIQQLLRK